MKRLPTIEGIKALLLTLPLASGSVKLFYNSLYRTYSVNTPVSQYNKLIGAINFKEHVKCYAHREIIPPIEEKTLRDVAYVLYQIYLKVPVRYMPNTTTITIIENYNPYAIK